MPDTPEAMTMQSFLKEDTDFDELLSSLSFREELVQVAAAHQPTLFVKAARLRVQCMRDRARADAQLDETKAESQARVREHLAQSGQKITIDAVADGATLDPAVQKMRATLRAAEAREEMGKLMLEAFRHRRDAIKVIAEAQLIEGHGPMLDATRSRELTGLRENARAVQAARRRVAMEEGEDA
jgi:hypothetical protein